MNPLLHDGEEVFVDPGAYRDGPPRVGDIVLSAHPYRADMQLLKSVREVGPEGAVFLIGEDPATSTDSRSFGPVPAACIRGRVVSKSK